MIKKYLCFIIIGIVSIAVLSFAGSALALEGETGLQNPLSVSTIDELISEIALIVTKIGGTAAVLFLIWSGFLFVSARGNETQLEKAKKVFQWTVIGTAVLLGAVVIAEVVVNFMQGL